MKNIARVRSKPEKFIPVLEEKRTYICVTCGKEYKKQEGNFPASQSPIYAGNNNRLSICKHCIDKLYDHYCVVLGNEDDAIRRICMKFDIYFDQSICDASRKISADRSRVQTFISRSNLVQYKDNTYDTTIDNESKDIIRSVKEIEENNIDVTQRMIKMWGVGSFSQEDYKSLDDHYKMLKKQNPNCDSNQEIFIKSLCHLNLLQMRALKDNDTKRYIDANSEYARTFKQAGLKTIQESDSSNDEVLGVTLATISQYTPEEYYKDKKLYKDFDGIGDYFTRFLKRPLKNLQFNTHDRDPEFYVKDDVDADE